MKSFVALVHTDGLPPDRALLARLARAIRLESSSEPEFAVDDRCGLAVVSHRGDAGIVSDGATKLAGDLRLDEPEDPLRAWRQWGSDCAAHLWGDFAFAIWDGETRTLFCARDRFGVWPLYYARVSGGLVVSDSLEAVLTHPDVPLDLDPRAVADYLGGGVPSDAEATIYAAVKRLAPAHTLQFGEELVTRRYWVLQPRERNVSGDAAERLEHALRQAIASRVTEPAAVVFMSGGLDSTALAALTRETKPDAQLLAVTSVYRQRIRDVEESFAVEAARSIGIPIRPVPLDGYSPLDSLRKGEWTAEPGPLLTASMTRDIYSMSATHAPIALHGHPADALFAADPGPHLRQLLRRGRLLRLIAAMVRYTAIKRRPPWFVLRRPDAGTDRVVKLLGSAMWSSWFEWAHPLQTGAPIRLVYPWLDPRVIEAALEIEPVPWLIDKHLLRTILRGRVSETIRRRRKTYLADDPWRIPLAEAGEVRIEAAAEYVDPLQFADAVRREGALADATLRAVALDYWLRELPRRVAALRSAVVET